MNKREKGKNLRVFPFFECAAVVSYKSGMKMSSKLRNNYNDGSCGQLPLHIDKYCSGGCPQPS
jgi:hypothetical protein